MNTKINFKETTPLRSKVSNIQTEQDANISSQSDINLTNSHSPIDLINQNNNINNIINENLNREQEKQRNDDNINDNFQQRHMVRIKTYFLFRQYPLIAVGTNSKFLFYIKYF